MTLDEAITHAEEIAKNCEFDTEWGLGNHFIDRRKVVEWGKEHRQLAEWLKELKMYRETIPLTNAYFIAKKEKSLTKELAKNVK